MSADYGRKEAFKNFMDELEKTLQTYSDTTVPSDEIKKLKTMAGYKVFCERSCVSGFNDDEAVEVLIEALETAQTLWKTYRGQW